MKALSLTQPWATLIAIGAKRIETRSWGTRHRGSIAIHASKGFPRACVQLCNEWPFEDVLLEHRDAWRKGLPVGAIVAVARLVDVVGTNDIMDDVMELDCPHELAFGDYAPGRFAWMLDDVRALKEPLACKGALGLWDVPPSILTALESPRDELRGDPVDGRV